MLKVTIRERKVKNATKVDSVTTKVDSVTSSLYLDYYKDNRRIVKALGIHFDPRDREGRDKAYFDAEQRRNAIIKDDMECGITFQEYEERYNPIPITENTRLSRLSAMRLVLRFDPFATISSINRKWVGDFVQFMKNLNMKDSSIHSRVAYVKSVVSGAYSSGLLKTRENLNGISPRMSDANREFLTMDEIRRFKEYMPKNEREKNVKVAFLFSCFTGLRLSDVMKLRYEDVKNGIMTITMTKTRRELSMPLSRNAISCVPEGSQGIIFKGMGIDTTLINRVLKYICRGSMINKHISFHCARHTFAVNALKYGGDIYVVSKLLGHCSIETTQTYLHCLDSDKQNLLDKIPTI